MGTHQRGDDDLPSTGEFQPRLPTLLSPNLAGAGDLIKRMTSAFGIPPCAGCQRRAERLNQLFPFGRQP